MEVVKEFKWETRHMAAKTDVNTALSLVHKHKVVDISVSRRSKLHSEPGQPSTLLLDFNYEESDETKYEAGDHLGIYPANRAKDVAYLQRRLVDFPASLDTPLVLMETTNGKVWHEVEDIPKCLSYNELLTYIVDMSRLPSQDVLKMFLKRADAEDEEKLKKIVSDEEAYFEWAKKKSNLVDALKEFPSVLLPSAELVGVLPPIQSRLYSIASAPEPEQGLVGLVVGVVETRAGSNKRQGLCSGMLQQGGDSISVSAFFKSAPSFKLPEDPSKSVIMIAAGSGIAPFRGFWKERARQAMQGVAVGSMLLLFGCRKEAMDLLKEETDQLNR